MSVQQASLVGHQSSHLNTRVHLLSRERCHAPVVKNGLLRKNACFGFVQLLQVYPFTNGQSADVLHLAKYCVLCSIRSHYVLTYLFPEIRAFLGIGIGPTCNARCTLTTQYIVSPVSSSVTSSAVQSAPTDKHTSW